MNTKKHLFEGVDLFERGFFWEAHESWEIAWKNISGQEKKWLQGIIQIAATFFHLERKKFSPAERLWKEAMDKLNLSPGSLSFVISGCVFDLTDVYRLSVAHSDVSLLPRVRITIRDEH